MLSATLLAVAGCRGPAFQAAHLPPEYRAAPRPTRGVINFAGIASPGVGDSVIAPGDLIRVTVDSGRNDKAPQASLTRVAEDGTADVHLIGLVAVAGLEPTVAGQEVAAAGVQRGIYLRPNVTVEIESKAVNTVTVLGAVSEPGPYELARNSSDLVNAIAKAGGLTKDAGDVVEVIRQPPMMSAFSPSAAVASNGASVGTEIKQVGYATHGGGPHAPGPTRIEVDLTKPFAAGDYRMGDRDVVMVRPRDEEIVYVSGLVKNAGQFEIPNDKELRLLEAIAMAGGETSPVADKVLIIRQHPNNSEPIAIRASIADCKRNSAENLVLITGDAISVERTPATVLVDSMLQVIRFSVGLTGRTALF